MDYTKVREAYRDYVNDFLTVEGFASFYGLSEEFARALLAEGRRLERERDALRS